MDNLKILIVDDIPANIISLEYLLSDYFDDIDILKASNGEEALKIAFKKEVNLIVLDIQMPVMDGFETAQFLKKNKKTKDIPIIFLTAAFKEEEFEKKGFKVGAIDYLTKPINNHHLINKLKLYIELFKKNIELLNNQKLLFEQSKLASMGEMIGNIAHQWRQPLSVISTAATGMQIQKEYNTLSDEDFNEACMAIDMNAQYLSKTIDNFTNFIKGERVEKQFNLREDIDIFIHLIEANIKENNINIILDIEENINLIGYPNELNQCFINIFNNSKDAFLEESAKHKKDTEENNRYIFISATKKNDKIIISLKDNAGGIEKDIIDKIFEPYFTTKHQSQGTGLGLHMTNNMIVNGMKGSIKVENQEYIFKNRNYIGANFIITLNQN